MSETPHFDAIVHSIREAGKLPCFNDSIHPKVSLECPVFHVGSSAPAVLKVSTKHWADEERIDERHEDVLILLRFLTEMRAIQPEVVK